MSERTITTTTPNGKIAVAGSPVALGMNGDYFPVNTSATGANRAWRGASTQRIYWSADYGWVIADLYANVSTEEFKFEYSTIYFYSGAGAAYEGITGDTNPWDITKWYTNIRSLVTYAEVISLIHSDDPEVTTTVETVKDYKYVLTEDETFEYLHAYYVQTELEQHKYVPVAQILIGDAVPDNTFYVKSATGYDYTSDVTFQENVTYYTRVYIGDDTIPYLYIPAVVAGAEVPADTYYEAKAEITRVTTTTVNHRTGERTVNTEETVTTTQVEQEVHKRYTVPDLQSGKVYRFSFVADFAELGYVAATDPNDPETNDITRGVYQLESTTTYHDLVLDGIDIYQNLYLPLGLSKEVFELDKAQWKNTDIWYKLVDPAQKSVIYYVPLSILAGIPDGNVTEYTRYQLVTDIGIFNDPELLTEIIDCVNMLFQAHFGIPTAASLAAYDSVWLPNDYYDKMTTRRKQNIEDFMMVNSAKYYNTLFYTEYNQLAKANNKLRASVKIYEELIPGMVKKSSD